MCELKNNARRYAESCIEARQCSGCKKDIGIEETIKQYIEEVESPWNGFDGDFNYNPSYVEVMCKDCFKKYIEKEQAESKEYKEAIIDTFKTDAGKYAMSASYTLLFLKNKYLIKGFAQDKNYEEPASRSWFEVELSTDKKEYAVAVFNELKVIKKEKCPEYNPGLFGHEKFIWGEMPNSNGKFVLYYH